MKGSININKNRLKNIAINTTLTFSSILLVLILAETMTYVIFDRINLQRGKSLPHPELVRVLEPYSAGHDKWGFRNSEVPKSVDIVAIGDSQTYGLAAQSIDSWPAQLSQISVKSVYNMGLGSYGPHQYRILLETKTLVLNPGLVVIGAYFGNDLSNASRYYDEVEKIRQNPGELPWETTVREDVGDFLSEYSNIYKLIANVVVVKAQLFLAKYGLYQFDPTYSELVDEENNFRTYLTPGKRIRALDESNPVIEKGFQLSLIEYEKIRKISERENLPLVVVLIPTKETAYKNLVYKNKGKIAHFDKLTELYRHEDNYIKRTILFFEQQGIDYIDIRAAMQAEASKGRHLYPDHDDGHPNKNGYEIIAKEVLKYIESIPRPKS